MASLFPQGAAEFSGDGVYRYRLTRELPKPQLCKSTGEAYLLKPCVRAHGHIGICSDVHGDERTVVFVMLNPSTADADKDDPTIRRCKGYAASWGYHRLVIVNLYAYRATRPDEMWKAFGAGVDIVGEDNNSAIVRAVQEVRACKADLLTLHAAKPPIVICAWGSGPTAKVYRAAFLERVTVVRRLVGEAAHYLKLNESDGMPGHPLYLAETLVPQRWAA